MGRPVVNGRSIIHEKGKIVGICLGHGGFSEHHIDDNKQYVQKFNRCHENLPVSFILFSRYNDPFNIPRVIEEYKADMKLLKTLSKENKKTVYEKYADYILRPHLNMFEREITIDNAAFKGAPGLHSGEYVYFSIEGINSWGYTDTFFKEKFDTQKVLKESDIFNSSDYANSCFHEPDLFMSSWSANRDRLALVIDKQIASGLLADLKQSLQDGYLALVYGAFNKKALSLVFVDKLMETGESSHSAIMDTTRMHLF